jgi:hypothetical protein
MRSGDFSNVVAINRSGTAGGAGWVPADIYNQFKSSAAGAFNPSASTTIYQHYKPRRQSVTQAGRACGRLRAFPGQQDSRVDARSDRD